MADSNDGKPATVVVRRRLNVVAASPLPRETYETRLTASRTALAARERDARTISTLRLITAAIALGLAAPVMRGLWSAWVLAGPGVAFVLLAIGHARVFTELERARWSVRWYERGLARLSGRWAGQGADGARLITDCPEARDLDLLGAGSLFQRINTALTDAGQATLAAWLTTGAAPEPLKARQAAVAELAPALAFREALAVAAAGADVSRTSRLDAWARAPRAGFPRWASPVMLTLSLGTATLLPFTLLGRIEPRALLVWMLAQCLVAALVHRQVRTALREIDVAATDLGRLGGVLARMEAQAFDAPLLRTLRASLDDNGVPPSRALARLERLIGWLDSSRNQIFTIVALLVALRSQLAIAIDRWHVRHAGAISRWVTAVGDLEALASLAAFTFERPDAVFPDVVPGAPQFAARRLTHPLLEGAVPNDVALGGAHPHLLIVSGSNMSGKSTLLRAIGVNTALAQAGGPVTAAALTLSPLRLGTSLRVDDSLQAGHSRFYAEILQVRRIVVLAGGGAPVLFLLDEMLAGTNSHDRRIGAEAIVRSLVARGAIGLVTTHDLALADIVPSLGPLAANVHFEDRIDEGRMRFDYRMKPGVVTHSNAVALMRSVGLDVGHEPPATPFMAGSA